MNTMLDKRAILLGSRLNYIFLENGSFYPRYFDEHDR